MINIRNRVFIDINSRYVVLLSVSFILEYDFQSMSYFEDHIDSSGVCLKFSIFPLEEHSIVDIEINTA